MEASCPSLPLGAAYEPFDQDIKVVSNQTGVSKVLPEDEYLLQAYLLSLRTLLMNGPWKTGERQRRGKEHSCLNQRLSLQNHWAGEDKF